MSPRRRQVWWLLKSPLGLIGLICCSIIVFLAIFGPLLAPYGPDQVDLNSILQGPSSAHWLGTDEVGRDLLTRLMDGAHYTLSAAVGVVAASLVVGTLIGSVAGYLGGWVGTVLMRLTDMFLSYPSLLLAIAVSAALGQGLLQASVALAVVVWAGYARIAYVQTVTIRGRLYMDAAEIAGTRPARRIFRHIMPNVISPLLIKATMDVAFSVEWIAGLGFIGLGATQPTPEWGATIADSRQYALTAWWYVVFPSVMLLLTILGFVLLGSAFEERVSGRRALSRAALRKLVATQVTRQSDAAAPAEEKAVAR